MDFIRLFSCHTSWMQLFLKSNLSIFPDIVLKPLVSLISHSIACSVRIAVDSHTHTQTNYRNPRCCMRTKGLIITDGDITHWHLVGETQGAISAALTNFISVFACEFRFNVCCTRTVHTSCTFLHMMSEFNKSSATSTFWSCHGSTLSATVNGNYSMSESVALEDRTVSRGW